ncbi:hypothetical protein [Actinomadura hibisca]|uniref:hypothetical protein n=1 Tax=Actinomadura hibisca TaxID=68565 RepID=UPI000832B30A|nr:hypothetical protein [Actinomadura hibisca]
MPDYTIVWETECQAINPREAAEQAWRMRSAPGSIANHFLVTNPRGETVTVDLADEESAELPPVDSTQRFGGPVRLGLVYATNDRPVDLALIEEPVRRAVTA